MYDLCLEKDTLQHMQKAETHIILCIRDCSCTVEGLYHPSALDKKV